MPKAKYPQVLKAIQLLKDILPEESEYFDTFLAKYDQKLAASAMTPAQKKIYKDPAKATDFALKNRVRFIQAEPYIATHPNRAYWYAHDILKGRFPEAEAAIAKDSEWSAKYLKLHPEAKLEWVVNGLLDWNDLNWL